MTERSGYSATKGQKAAFKELKPKLLNKEYKSNLMKQGQESKFKKLDAIGGTDGS